MKKIFTLMVLAGMFAACHIVTPEDPVNEDTTEAYEAYGPMTITSSGFTKENVRTKIVLTDDNKLDLYMFDVKFAAGMPVTIDMLVSGIDYTKNGNTILFQADGIIPTAGNKPYEKYVIRDLTGRITSDSLCLSNKYGETPSIYAGKISK